MNLFKHIAGRLLFTAALISGLSPILHATMLTGASANFLTLPITLADGSYTFYVDTGASEPEPSPMFPVGAGITLLALTFGRKRQSR